MELRRRRATERCGDERGHLLPARPNGRRRAPCESAGAGRSVDRLDLCQNLVLTAVVTSNSSPAGARGIAPSQIRTSCLDSGRFSTDAGSVRCVRDARSLEVSVDLLPRSRRRLIRILCGLSMGAALTKQVPALVERLFKLMEACRGVAHLANAREDVGVVHIAQPRGAYGCGMFAGP